MTTIQDTLNERGTRYGDFFDHSRFATNIQEAMQETDPAKWNRLPSYVKRGLTTIADKIARILNGDEWYEDSYHDIVGYAKLMEDNIKKANAERKISKELDAYYMPVLYHRESIDPKSLTAAKKLI